MSGNTDNLKALSDDAVEDEFPDELQAGAQLLGGQYTIKKFLNSGGFGITYLAKDSLDRDVVIKECFPDSICRRSTSLVRARSRAHLSTFGSVVELFEQEAKSQAKLEHPNIVGIHQVFRDNDTAYMAIDYIKGSDLLDVIQGEDKQSADDTERWLRGILDAVGFIHDAGMLHRDISPDNILINDKNEPILIDFGAAREQASKTDRVLSTMRVVKDGYSPQEFYVAGSTQNASSDLYALAATFYHVISGEAPADSQSRLAGIAQDQSDIYKPLAGRIEGYPKGFLASVDKALKVLPKDRFQSAKEWMDALDEKDTKSKVKVNAVENATSGDKKKSKVPLIAAASVVVALGAGGAFMMNPTLGSKTAATKDQQPTISAEKAETEVAVTEIAAETATNSDQVEQELVVETPPAEEEVASLSAQSTPNDTAPAETTPVVATPVEATPVETEPVQTTAPATGDNNGVEIATNSSWTVNLPFETTGTSVTEGTFAMVTLVRSDLDVDAQAWLKSGSIIYSINGNLVYDSQSVMRAITQSTNLAEEQSVTVNVRTRSSKEDPLTEQELTLPVVRSIELQNGFRFNVMKSGSDWKTQVAFIPRDVSTTLEVGDVILSEAQTNVVMLNVDDIEKALAQLGEQTAYFTISRAGKLESATASFGKI